MASKVILAAIMLTLTTMVNAQRHESNYLVRGDEAIYDGKVIREADAKTFQILGQGYAKDQYNVYLDGQVLRFVDPLTFRLKEQGDAYSHRGTERPVDNHRGDYAHRPTYHKDNFNVYFNGEKVKGASAQTFRDLGDGYGCDSFYAYYFGEKIAGSAGSSFKLIGHGYSKDAFNVFYNGEKIQGASISSFRVDKDGYAHDAFNTFYFGKKIK